MTDEQESPDINSEYFSSASSRDLLLSEFQIDYCDGTESTFEVREWRISEDAMLDYSKILESRRSKPLEEECSV